VPVLDACPLAGLVARSAGVETRIVPLLHEHFSLERASTPVRQVRIEDQPEGEPMREVWREVMLKCEPGDGVPRCVAQKRAADGAERFGGASEQRARHGRGGIVPGHEAPEKIVDLARELIARTASPGGSQVEVRIHRLTIRVKMYDELFFGAEQAGPSTHAKVMYASGTQVSAPVAAVMSAAFEELSYAPEAGRVRDLIKAGQWTGVRERAGALLRADGALRSRPRYDGHGDVVVRAEETT